MAFKETAKEKEKREAYYKANKEKGIRAEKQKEYEMFGTTEQNIPEVDTMGNVTGMKKGGKVKKLALGGGLRGMARPAQSPMPTQSQSQAAAVRGTPQVAPPMARPQVTPQRPMPDMGRPTGTGLAGMARPQVAPPAMARATGAGMGAMGARPGMKKGGSASSRADGCAQRGKTKGRIV